MNQRDGVFKAVQEVIGQDSFSERVVLTSDQRKRVIDLVTNGIILDEVNMSDNAKLTYDTPEKIKSYVASLVSDCVRKDTRMNGGSKYTPTKPGTRTGSKDEQIQAMRAARKSFVISGDAEKVRIIDEEITNRIKTLQASKPASSPKTKTPKTISVDLSMIPAELKASLGLG